LSFCKKNRRDLFLKFCDRTGFIRTRKSLHAVIEEIRKELSNHTGYANQPYRVVNSIPIPACKFGRAKFHKTFIPMELLLEDVFSKKKLT